MMERWEVEVILKNGKKRIVYEGDYDDANDWYQVYINRSYVTDYCFFGLIRIKREYSTVTLRKVKKGAVEVTRKNGKKRIIYEGDYETAHRVYAICVVDQFYYHHLFWFIQFRIPYDTVTLMQVKWVK